MRKIVVGTLMFAAVLMLGSQLASAQINMKVTLPFAFQAEEMQFPAGSYSMSQSNPSARFAIRSQKGKEGGTFAVSPLPPEGAFEKERTFLVFNKVDDKYFLSQVWSKHIGRQLTEPQAVKDARSGGKQVSEVKVNVKM